MDEIPNDPLLEYIFQEMIEEDRHKAVKIFLEANYMLKKALDRVSELEEKYKDFDR